MNIRCPECQARYVIDETALAATGGQVRCYLCGHVFDARQQAVGDRAADELDVPRILQQLRPDQPRPAATTPAAGPAETRAPAPAPAPATAPAALPALDAVPALDMEAALGAPRRRGWRLLGGGVLILLLLGLAAAQLAWLERERLLQDPRARVLAAWACSHLPCSVPARRDPDAFVVLERSLMPAAATDAALNLKVQFANRAAYAQPLPQLQLSLFDNQQRVLARRSLQPHEYLLPDAYGQRLVEPEEVVTIDLLLEDLGPSATGFELAFF